MKTLGELAEERRLTKKDTKQHKELLRAIQRPAGTIMSHDVTGLDRLLASFLDTLDAKLTEITVRIPDITIPKSEVIVNPTPVIVPKPDLSRIITAIENLDRGPTTISLEPVVSALKSLETKLGKPPTVDSGELKKAILSVKRSIDTLQFPVNSSGSGHEYTSGTGLDALYGRLGMGSDGTTTPKPISVDTSGNQNVNVVGGSISIDPGDIEIGAVELKNGTDDTRATVTASNALKVDGSAVTQPVSGTITATPEKGTSAGTSTGISVGSSSTTILASNASRKEAIIVNDSNETIYLKFGSGAALNSGVRLNANGGTLVENVYTGIITGISTSGSKNVTVTEV